MINTLYFSHEPHSCLAFFWSEVLLVYISWRMKEFLQKYEKFFILRNFFHLLTKNFYSQFIFYFYMLLNTNNLATQIYHFLFVANFFLSFSVQNSSILSSLSPKEIRNYFYFFFFHSQFKHQNETKLNDLHLCC